MRAGAREAQRLDQAVSHQAGPAGGRDPCRPRSTTAQAGADLRPEDMADDQGATRSPRAADRLVTGTAARRSRDRLRVLAGGVLCVACATQPAGPVGASGRGSSGGDTQMVEASAAVVV